MNSIDNSPSHSLASYIKQIYQDKIHHYEWPKEIKSHPSIITAEVAVGARVFKNRGYNVIKSAFFVEQIITTFRTNDTTHESSESLTFNTFEEYYNFLNGDIYSSASYYQYVFTEAEITRFKIDLSRIKTSAFIQDTLKERSKIMDEEDNKKLTAQNESWEKFLKWKTKFCSSKNLKQLTRCYYEFRYSLAFKDSDFMRLLSFFVSLNPKTNIPLAIQLLLENKLTLRAYETFFNMLCLESGDDEILDYFPSSYHQRKSILKALKKKVISKDITIISNKYYSPDKGLYYINKYAVEMSEMQIHGEMTYYYETLEDFLTAINYDLTRCVLPKSVIAQINDSGVKVTGSATPLPEESAESNYHIEKGYTPCYDLTTKPTDFFYVTEVWSTPDNSDQSKSRTHKFKHFIDFASFLEYDLSNADLLMCDGLKNFSDFTGINWNGAILSSEIKERIGILNREELLPIPAPSTIEYTLSNESIFEKIQLSNHTEQNWSASNWEIHYISDLHLTHKLADKKYITEADVQYLLKKTAQQITLDVSYRGILIIAGDTSCDFEIFKSFVSELSKTHCKNIVFVLGNHELWDFEETSFDNITHTYREVIESAGMHLLQNSLIYEVNNRLTSLSENELLSMDKAQLRKKLATTTFILFGGLGFSGQNKAINADSGMYKNALSRKNEICESIKFEKLYSKVRSVFSDKPVIVTTHTPFEDWSQDTEYHSGFSYINGHTHRNSFIDNGIATVYADNQIGYYRKNLKTKTFYTRCNYDLFSDYEDGLYSITREEYINFYRGNSITVTFNKDFEHLYMLKKKGYYCFIIQTDNAKLSILNKGATKIIKPKKIEECYAEISNIIDAIKDPLKDYMDVQHRISDFIKTIGGSGRIHGAIIDIDFSNHIFVNPNDMKITGYYAESMTNKLVYGSLQKLIAAQCPHLLPAWNEHISKDNESAIIIRDSNNDFDCMHVPSTDIYRVSNILKKMQCLEDRVLCFWPDNKPNHSNPQIIQLAGQKTLLADEK